MQISRETLPYYCYYRYDCLTGVVCFGGGGFVPVCGKLAVSGDVSPSLGSEGESLPPPQKETSTQTNQKRIRNDLPRPCCSQSPQSRPVGGLRGPCASLSNDTPSESHSRAGPRRPRKGSTARGFGLAEPPQVGPLTTIPPPHFSVDDLIELCLFVPGTAEHVLEAINYRNVAISKRTPGTG